MVTLYDTNNIRFPPSSANQFGSLSRFHKAIKVNLRVANNGTTAGITDAKFIRISLRSRSLRRANEGYAKSDTKQKWRTHHASPHVERRLLKPSYQAQGPYVVPTARRKFCGEFQQDQRLSAASAADPRPKVRPVSSRKVCVKRPSADVGKEHVERQ
jgi:hypothetical protein